MKMSISYLIKKSKEYGASADEIEYLELLWRDVMIKTIEYESMKLIYKSDTFAADQTRLLLKCIDIKNECACAKLKSNFIDVYVSKLLMAKSEILTQIAIDTMCFQQIELMFDELELQILESTYLRRPNLEELYTKIDDARIECLHTLIPNRQFLTDSDSNPLIMTVMKKYQNLIQKIDQNHLEDVD